MIKLFTKIKDQLSAAKNKLFSQKKQYKRRKLEKRIPWKESREPEERIPWEEQRKNRIFKEFDDFEYDVHDEAIEKVGRAIQMAHNNQIKGNRMSVSFIDGYGEQFIVVIGKEEELLSDDTFKNSRMRERFYLGLRKEFYMAIGISRDKLIGCEDFCAEYEEHC